jgi:hypothetical protein
MADARHHHAVQVIFVETPSAGSPKSTREVKPGNYPRQDRTPWMPRTKPPNKAEKLVKFLDRIGEQDREVRSFMRPDLALLKARYNPEGDYHAR